MNGQLVQSPLTLSPAIMGEIHDYFNNEQNVLRLRRILRSYIRKARIAPVNEEAEQDAAYELLQDLVMKALDLAEKYSGAGLQAWLLCIAKNLVMQKRDKLVIRKKYEISPSVRPKQAVEDGIEDIFDSWTLSYDLEQSVGTKMQFQAALVCLSPDDRVALSLSKYHGYSHKEIAQMLEMTEVAVRVRVMRALHRFRDAWNAQEEDR